MMEYLFAVLGAVLQILFAYQFLSLFLEVRCDSESGRWLLALACLLNAVYGLIGVDGMYGYLLYLLMSVLLLLCVFGESGAKGLALLVFTILIPVAVDLTVMQLSFRLGDAAFAGCVTAGRMASLGLVLILRRFRSSLGIPSGEGEDRDTLLLRQHMELQRESMSALEQNYRLQRKSTHEFEHHLQVLRDLLSQGEVDSAQDYLNRLRKNRSIHLMSVNSHHPVIDVILNQKHQTACENDIKMQIRVNDLSAVDIPADSLVVILTNLLDNAIEACRRIDGYREIRCSVLGDDGLYISVRNTSDPVDIVDGKIATSKQDSLSHGFGLMSVTYVLEELGGEYTFGYEDGWFHFAAEIE